MTKPSDFTYCGDDGEPIMPRLDPPPPGTP
jgi:hypothetical protein